jgi:hypothetical protein
MGDWIFESVQKKWKRFALNSCLHKNVMRKINATDCMRNRMVRHPQMRRTSGGETQTNISAELSDD